MLLGSNGDVRKLRSLSEQRQKSSVEVEGAKNMYAPLHPTGFCIVVYVACVHILTRIIIYIYYLIVDQFKFGKMEKSTRDSLLFLWLAPFTTKSVMTKELESPVSLAYEFSCCVN